MDDAKGDVTGNGNDVIVHAAGSHVDVQRKIDAVWDGTAAGRTTEASFDANRRGQHGEIQHVGKQNGGIQYGGIQHGRIKAVRSNVKLHGDKYDVQSDGAVSGECYFVGFVAEFEKNRTLKLCQHSDLSIDKFKHVHPSVRPSVINNSRQNNPRFYILTSSGDEDDDDDGAAYHHHRHHHSSRLGHVTAKQDGAYYSQANELSIWFLDAYDYPEFLLQYEAVGCVLPEEPPYNGWMRLDEGRLLIGCKSLPEVWQLTCADNGSWSEPLPNCSEMRAETGRTLNSDAVVQLNDAFPVGVLLIVSIGVSLGVFFGGILLSLVALLIKKNRTQNEQFPTATGSRDFLRDLFTPSPPHSSSSAIPRSSPIEGRMISPFECPTPPYVADIISGHSLRLANESETIRRLKATGVCSECYKELSRNAIALVTTKQPADESTEAAIGQYRQSASCDNSVCTCERVVDNAVVVA